jgi:DNA-binding beta-propeller fold protein YncE
MRSGCYRQAITAGLIVATITACTTPNPNRRRDASVEPTDSGADAMIPKCKNIQVSTIAGSVEGNMNGAGNVATFKRPEGITVDPATGTLYVADTGNKLIRKVLSDGTTSTYSTMIQPPPQTQSWITPRHASFPPGYNNLYICDNGNDQVYAVGQDGTASSFFALGNLQAFAVQPTTFGAFVIDWNRVAKWIPGGGIEATVFSGTFDTGFVDGPAAVARYGHMLDLAFDGDTNLYVADQGNHRIRKVNVTSGPNYGDVMTVAGSTAGHLDGTGAAAQFEGPNALVIDQASHLAYIADGPTIRVMTPTGEVSTLAGSNSAYLDGDGCTAKFINIRSIAKFANELYILDVNRIRKIVLN